MLEWMVFDDEWIYFCSFFSFRFPGFFFEMNFQSKGSIQQRQQKQIHLFFVFLIYLYICVYVLILKVMNLYMLTKALEQYGNWLNLVLESMLISECTVFIVLVMLAYCRCRILTFAALHCSFFLFVFFLVLLLLLYTAISEAFYFEWIDHCVASYASKWIWIEAFSFFSFNIVIVHEVRSFHICCCILKTLHQI